MLNQQQKLTPQESAFAGSHFKLVQSFLKDNHLLDDDYYDCAINGFLKAVQTHCSAENFKNIAVTYMSAECTAYDEAQQKSPTVISFSECYKNVHELEETIADVKNTMEDAISAINLKNTLQSFDVNQQRIIALLLEGYTQADIASVLQISLSALCDEICVIKQKTSHLMMAA